MPDPDTQAGPIFEPGQALQVLSTEGLNCKPALRVGQQVTCHRMSHNGDHVILVERSGFFQASRFEAIR